MRRADDELQAAYRRIPQDPDVVQMAAQLAAATMPECSPRDIVWQTLALQPVDALYAS